VEVDAGHFEAALVNLAVNARDAMPEGGALLIAARNVSAGEARLIDPRLAGECVEIRAVDTGVGIPPEHLDKVIEPFFTTKPPGKGTGLGLAISYDIIVQGHGGTLEFNSEEGKYTEFVMTLPKRAASAGAPVKEVA
jgi:signal transduction histidine kinase